MSKLACENRNRYRRESEQRRRYSCAARAASAVCAERIVRRRERKGRHGAAEVGHDAPVLVRRLRTH